MLELGSRLLKLFLVLLLVGTWSCKCGEKKDGTADGQPVERDYQSTVSKLPGAPMVDVARLVPDQVDLALISSQPDRIYTWLEQRQWWQGIQKSPLWADLTLSGTMYELSTMRHKLASMSPVDIRQPKLKELLASPMAFGLKRTDSGTSAIMVKQIDLRIQAMDRLAEVFNQVREGDLISTSEVAGHPVRSLQTGAGAQLHYALYSNLLLASNDEELLEKSILLASGKASDSLAQSSPSKDLLAQAEKDDSLLVFMRPHELSPWLGYLLPAQIMSFRINLGDSSQAQVAGIPPAGKASSLSGKKLEELLGMVPLNCGLVVGHVDLQVGDLFNSLAQSMPGRAKDFKAAEKKVFGNCTGEALAVFMGFEEEQLPLPGGLLFLRLKNDKGIKEALVVMMEALFGQAPRESAGGVFYADGAGFRPAFMVSSSGWLVLGSSRRLVQLAASTGGGQSPSILDLKGYKEQVLSRAAPFYGLGFIDFGMVFSQLQQFAGSMVRRSERFDENDVKDTLGPFMGAMQQIGKIGGGLALKGGKIEGGVIPL